MIDPRCSVCETEPATQRLSGTDDGYLCRCCAAAYSYGQDHPTAEFVDLSDEHSYTVRQTREVLVTASSPEQAARIARDLVESDPENIATSYEVEVGGEYEEVWEPIDLSA